jgi:transcriptional regulator with XRE-family HTH domain
MPPFRREAAPETREHSCGATDKLVCFAGPFALGRVNTRSKCFFGVRSDHWGGEVTNDPIQLRRSDDLPDTEDAFLQAVGRRVRDARHKSGLSSMEVVEKVGCSKGWLYGIESGTQNFTIQMFRRLLQTLRVEFSEIFATGGELHDKAAMERLHTIASRTVLQAGAAAHALAEVRALSDELRVLTEDISARPKISQP